jgi:hypothetical protein
MKTWSRGVLLGALALAACGRSAGGGGNGTLSTKPAPDPATATAPASGPGDCPKGVTIRIIGTHPDKVSSLVLTPAGAGATCAPVAPGCATHAGSEATAPIDVSSDAVAHDLGTFDYPPAGLPPDGGPATLTVIFSGGTATVGDTSGPLSICGPTVHVPFDPSRVSRDRCSITILLDVGRSVVPTATGIDFVPQYRIFF